MKRIPEKITSYGGSWDVHAHVVPQEIVDAAEKKQFGMEVDGQFLAIGKIRVILSKYLVEKGIFEARETLADHVVVSVPPAFLRYDMDYNDTVFWTELVNDGLERLVSSGDNFWGLAYLPLNHPGLALREMEKRDGAPWLGYVIGTTVGDRLLDDPSLDPVYEALNRRKAFVFVHPLDTPDKRQSRYYLKNLLGNPVETGLAMASLIFSGNLIKYPDIQFCFAHGGGVAPQLVGRWQRGVKTDRPGLVKLAAEPKELICRVYVDTLVHDLRNLRHIIEVFGKDRVLPGTDFPFPMGESLKESTVNRLPRALREQILYHNAPTLWGFNTTME